MARAAKPFCRQGHARVFKRYSTGRGEWRCLECEKIASRERSQRHQEAGDTSSGHPHKERTHHLRYDPFMKSMGELEVTESVGPCARCGHSGPLGNGLCQRCWDIQCSQLAEHSKRRYSRIDGHNRETS